MRHVSTFLAGGLFAVGLAIAGMTQPSKVIGFLDFTGNWDPSLAFVMVGAILVNLMFHRFVVLPRARQDLKPAFATRFQIPSRNDLTPRLVIGSGLFGIGWALGGYCPGPALASSATGTNALVFIVSMAAGMVTWKMLDRAMSAKQAAAAAPVASATSEPSSSAA